MAKSKYTEIKKKLKTVEKWAGDGLTNEQIADNLGVGLTAFYEYKQKYTEFSEALKKGREKSVMLVENALFKKALGYSVIIKKSYKVRKVDYNEVTGKKIREYEEVITVDEEIYIPPETAAICFILKNRAANRWQDNPKKLELERDKFKFEKTKHAEETF